MKSRGVSLFVTACAGFMVAACGGKLVFGTFNARTGPDGGSDGSSTGGASGFGGSPKSGPANGGKGTFDGGSGGTGIAGFSGSTGDAASGGAAADGAAGSSTVEGGVPDGPTGPWWPHRTTVGCQSAGVPLGTDRVKSDSGDNIGPIYLAMNRARIGAVNEAPDPRYPAITSLVPNPEAWRTIGFDIDGTCTRSATCQMREELVDERSCANAETVPFDGDNCVDNAVGNLFNIVAQSPSLGIWFGMSEADWNCEMWRGGFSVVLKISDYNGQYNDDTVEVDLYTSIGLKVLPQWTCRENVQKLLDPTWNTHAGWSANMHWIISQDSIDPSARPMAGDVPNSKWRDVSAFVRGGWLVTHFPDGSSLWFDGERTPVPGLRQIMHRSVVAMQLVKNPQTNLWTMENGTLAFATTPDEALAGLAQIGLCENMCGTFATIRDYLQTYRDTLSSDGNAPATTNCDALSYGMTFRGAQISADATDVQPTGPFTSCPEPRHPGAPRQNCRCTPDGSSCTAADAGN